MSPARAPSLQTRSGLKCTSQENLADPGPQAGPPDWQDSVRKQTIQLDQAHVAFDLVEPGEAERVACGIQHHSHLIKVVVGQPMGSAEAPRSGLVPRLSTILNADLKVHHLDQRVWQLGPSSSGSYRSIRFRGGMSRVPDTELSGTS